MTRPSSLHLSRLSRLTAAMAVVLLVAGCTGATAGSVPTMPPAQPDVAGTPKPAHPGPTYSPDCPTSQPPALTAADARTVTIETSLGTIVVAVKGSLSPIATGNFTALASCGYYDGVVFHRVVPNFVIQGGDGQFGRSPNVYPDLVGSGGVPYTIKDEPVTTTYKRGTVAMARTRLPDSVTSQFFIVVDDSAAAALASVNNYQIVGTVTSGMDVVDKIVAAADKEIPTNPIAMTKVTVTNP